MASHRENGTSSRSEPPTGGARAPRAKCSVLSCQDVSTVDFIQYECACVCFKMCIIPKLTTTFVYCQPAAGPRHPQKSKTAAGLATLLPNRIQTMRNRISKQQSRQKNQQQQPLSHGLLHLSGVDVPSPSHAPITASCPL